MTIPLLREGPNLRTGTHSLQGLQVFCFFSHFVYTMMASNNIERASNASGALVEMVDSVVGQALKIHLYNYYL